MDHPPSNGAPFDANQAAKNRFHSVRCSYALGRLLTPGTGEPERLAHHQAAAAFQSDHHSSGKAGRLGAAVTAGVAHGPERVIDAEAAARLSMRSAL